MTTFEDQGGSAATAEGTGDEELVLPEVSPPELPELIDHAPGPPPGGQPCRRCGGTVGLGYGGQRDLERGFCSYCRTPFSFERKLDRDDLVGEQYEVTGCLALGGQGWIYLARDRQVNDRRVVLKSVIDPGDSTQLKMAQAESRFLTDLDHHPDIVRIYNSVTKDDINYIVMEYVPGRTLEDLARPHQQARWLGTRLTLEHVAVYGCRILEALSHLHGRGLLFGDMSPSNVMHHGTRIKLIDLGGMRRKGDDASHGVRTPPYLPMEELRRHTGAGYCELTDLYAVARTLQEVAHGADDAPPPARESFDAVIERATSEHLAARFTTAAGMARQLRGVLREIRAMTRREQHTAQSLLFAPAVGLLDGGRREEGVGLGRPQPARWRLRPLQKADPLLDVRPPAPAWVARRLPVPVPHPDNEAAATELRAFHDSLLHGILPAARQRLADACGALGEQRAHHDWRVSWACGLLTLAEDDPGAAPGEPAALSEPADTRSALRAVLDATPERRPARHWFEHVRRALPGEPAPKLALAYCFERDYHHDPDREERRDDLARAGHLYQAVWWRDRSEGSAAFGLARLRLAQGRRVSALEILDELAEQRSPHHRAARVAAARVQVAWLPDHPPEGTDFEAVRQRLARDPGGVPSDGWPLEEGELLLLTAEIRESALHWSATHTWPPATLRPGELFGGPPTTDRLRSLQEDTLRRLARRAASTLEHDELIDRANQTRPETLT
ncbi:tetratricopeptide repeat protein [Streptomyces sp. 4N509B]|uniref:tetratricopeptide repeat protein n=1 Tax=Streptomyces sp. 4N509B TaxID=3457413 RepID=UPI003FD28148